MSGSIPKDQLRSLLESIYGRFHLRQLVEPDPLQFLYDYAEIGDREVAGFIAASLAYGRVAQIIRNVSFVLGKLGRSPKDHILHTPAEEILNRLNGFRHRFSTAKEVVALIQAMAGAIRRYGSLNECLLRYLKPGERDVCGAVEGLACELHDMAGSNIDTLLPFPQRGSACKRIHLFLRWMVRCDDVDPGGWMGVEPSQLIVPMDTHMTRLGQLLGITKRKQPDITTAREVTDAFREICPEDPVKYDFSLTRLGIRREVDIKELFAGFSSDMGR